MYEDGSRLGQHQIYCNPMLDIGYSTWPVLLAARWTLIWCWLQCTASLCSCPQATLCFLAGHKQAAAWVGLPLSA